MHDIMDRVTNISWRTTSGAAIGGFQYEYDAAGRIVSRSHALGDPSHPSQMSQSSQKSYAYDDLGSLTNETVIGVAGTKTIERFWDVYGRTAGYALSGTRQTTLGYDPATARIESMLANGSETPFIWSYYPGSDLKSSLAYPEKHSTNVVKEVGDLRMSKNTRILHFNRRRLAGMLLLCVAALLSGCRYSYTNVSFRSIMSGWCHAKNSCDPYSSSWRFRGALEVYEERVYLLSDDEKSELLKFLERMHGTTPFDSICCVDGFYTLEMGKPDYDKRVFCCDLLVTYKGKVVNFECYSKEDAEALQCLFKKLISKVDLLCKQHPMQ